MNDPDLEGRIAKLSDIELVRLLAVNAQDNPPEVFVAAEAEAKRRGLRIDEAFVPASEPEDLALPKLSRYQAGGAPVVCAQCRNAWFENRTVLLDGLNPSAIALVCSKCGLVQLFTRTSDVLAEDV